MERAKDIWEELGLPKLNVQKPGTVIRLVHGIRYGTKPGGVPPRAIICSTDAFQPR